MKSFFIKSLFTTVMAAGLLTGCVNSDDYDTPNLDCVELNLVANKSVADLFAMATESLQQYTDDDVIEAYVTSSDERGTFFKVVTFQTLATETTPSIGFSVNIDQVGLFGKGFIPGRKVFIRLKDLNYMIDFDALELGAEYDGTVGRLPEQTYLNNIIPACTQISEDELAEEMTIGEALNDANLNKLIDLTNVQFKEESFGYTLYDESAPTTNGSNPRTIGGATNHLLVGQDGYEVIFRTSSYASFAGMAVPQGSGTVRGVLTKYFDDYQFIPRFETDLMLDNERFCTELSGSSATAKGSCSLDYYSSYTETFESFAISANSIPNYVNDYTTGGRYWQVKQYSNNKYIEMTSYNGSTNPGVVAKSHFFVPVNFDAASTMSFDKEIRYMAGQALKVYYVTDANYTPGDVYNVANFTDITAEFTNLIYPSNGSSQNSFTTAGTYNIPASLTGNGYFVFEYSGTATITTTIQIDNIAIN